MKINKFSQIGKRSNNEDSLGVSNGLLTVCDGMGGHNYGERASAFVKEALLKVFAEPQQLGKMEIQQQLNNVQSNLNHLLDKEPELEKMGTTFTGVFITPDMWYAAHIGDSRIYLFRTSEQKLWHTWDHSLVGELMRTKEITVEAGRFHPMSNRISKAIIAQTDGKPVSASIVKIDELKAGDIFLLCSDGVVEGWGDWELIQLFSDESLSFEQKCKKIAEQCNSKSKDNNTAIIAEIEEADAFSYGNNDELEWTTFAEVKADYQQYVNDNEEVKPAISTPEAPDIPKSKAEISNQESQKQKMSQFQSSPATQQPSRHIMNSGSNNKTNKKPLVLLVTLLLIVFIGMLLIFKKGKTNTPDPDTKAYEACKTVTDYRNYLSDFGRNAQHYANAKAFVDKYEADSISKVKQSQHKTDAQADKSESKLKEKKAYEACITIPACDSYLKVYPKGSYVDKVKAKKAELEKQQNEAEVEQKAKNEAKKKEDEAYYKCKKYNTIEACEEYLKAYPHSRYHADVQALKDSLLNARAEPEYKEEQVNPISVDPVETENSESNPTEKLENLSPEQKEIIEQSGGEKTKWWKKSSKRKGKGNNTNTTDTVIKKD